VTGLLGLIHKENLCGGGHGNWPRFNHTEDRPALGRSWWRGSEGSDTGRACAGEARATGLGLTTRKPSLCKIVHSD
jgi:hypothetical protein